MHRIRCTPHFVVVTTSGIIVHSRRGVAGVLKEVLVEFSRVPSRQREERRGRRSVGAGMDFVGSAMDIVPLASFILVLLLNTHRALDLPSSSTNEEEAGSDLNLVEACGDPGFFDVHAMSQAVLHHWRIWSSLAFLEEDLGFWVKPRSTTWFSNFLLEEYNDERWIKMFCMTKRSMLLLATILTPMIRRRDTNYRLAVSVTVRVACALFKLTQGGSLLICSELFAVGRSIVSILLCEAIQAITMVLQKEISWSSGERITSIANDFQRLCGLSTVLGAINGTHFAISKPRFAPADYYYFKSGGYSMQCQAVVDNNKHFLDIHVGMPRSTNDSRVLRRSSLFHRSQHNNLWEGRPSFHGYSPYLLGDSGFPLLLWLMVLHRQQGDLTVSERLFNTKLSRGRVVVENAFAVLKQTFRELHHKSDLHVTFFPDVVIACCILYNVLLQQSHAEVETLLEVLRNEGLDEECEEPSREVEDCPAADEVVELESSQQKRSELGFFLALQRIVPF